MGILPSQELGISLSLLGICLSISLGTFIHHPSVVFDQSKPHESGHTYNCEISSVLPITEAWLAIKSDCFSISHRFRPNPTEAEMGWAGNWFSQDTFYT